MVENSGWRWALAVGLALSACSVDSRDPSSGERGAGDESSGGDGAVPQAGQPSYIDGLPVIDERGFPEPVDEVGFVELEG